jgi:hypothetical protein
MRETIAIDPNNVDKIGSPDNPGLKAGTLTREQHRDRLAGRYQGRANDLEELLDSLYGPEPKDETDDQS